MNRLTLVSISIIIFFLFLIITACDNYNLMDQFSTEDELAAELVFDVQKTSLQQGEAIELYPGGGLEPYNYSILVDTEKLYYISTLGSIVYNTYTAGNSIGSLIIKLTDSNSNSVEKEITIIPPAPSSFAVDGATGTNRIDLSWTYSDTEIISGFIIMRAIESGEYEELISLGSSNTSYQDTGLNQNFEYHYYMYAVSGDYLSLPTSIGTDTPNS